jgi:putative pyrroloquinoline-quinone binding quinoprotein
MDVDVSSAPIIIDLGYERGEPPTYRSRQRSTTPSWFPVAMLSALVLLFAGGSAGPAKSPLSAVFQLPVGPADGYALTETGTLLAQSYGQLSSYDLRTGRLRWEAGESTPSYRLRTVGNLVLMRPLAIGGAAPGTTAVSINNGAGRWARAGNVVTVPGSPTLLGVSGLRSFTSSSGNVRRVTGTVDAIDPYTGRTLWSVAVPGTAVLVGVPGPGDEGGRMLLIRDDRTATLHDLSDGSVLATAKLTLADYGTDNPVVAGGEILVRHAGTESVELSAYDPVTLKQVWTIPVAGTFAVESCGDVACLVSSHGLIGIDPATGGRLWSRPGWTTIEQEGRVFVAYGGQGTDNPIGVVDPQTGTVQVQLHGWRPVEGSGGDGLLVTRTEAGGARTMVAVARPGDMQPQVLAPLPTGTGDCQAAPGRLVCRSMYGQLTIWAYGKV